MYYPRRSLRRSLVACILLGCVVFFAGYLRDLAHDSAHPPRIEVKTVQAPVTVTRIRTVWARITQTVFASGSEATPSPTDKKIVDRMEGQPLQEIDPESENLPLQSHDYRPDGLLEVNPDGPHPIFDLIRHSETAWESKLKAASKTLEEAVVEYVRRYHRQPPLGFDDWWYYVEQHRIQLPDEYDQIYKDLEPYWGMDPKDLQTIQSDWEAHADSYTLGKGADGPITVVNFTLPGNDKVQFDLAGGGFQIIELLEDVQDFLPAFRAVFSPHDNPNLPTDFELKSMALLAANTNSVIDINNPPEVKLHGWLSGCDPMSPAWRDPIDYSSPAPRRTKKTFIHDHRESMDPCKHPSLLLSHGQFLSHNTGPIPHRTMVPQFSYCPTLLHHDIMASMPINWVEDILPRSDDPEWDQKTDDRLLWRGSNTGIWHDENTKWMAAQRVNLVDWATRRFDENVTVLRPPRNERHRVGAAVEVKQSKYGPALLDVAFAGQPVSCAPDTCEKLKKMYEYRQMQDIKTAGNYKYVLDVDGNGWSSRFKRLITSNSLVFKSTVYPEWFTDRIAPWVHYIPVQVDLSDLYDSLIFFRGDPNGDNDHDDLARKIASAGRQWSKTFWRKEDLTAYMFRLFLEYGRVMSPNRAEMSFSLSQVES